MRPEDAVAALQNLAVSSALVERERLALRVLFRIALEHGRDARSEEDTRPIGPRKP